MNGLEAAKRLRAQDENVCIIFITTLAKYAIRGYEVNALDFLVKPVEYELFASSCKRRSPTAAAAGRKRSASSPPARCAASALPIFLLWRATSTTSSSMWGRTSCAPRGSMRDIREQFLRNGFASIRNSTLVNLAHVDGFTGSEVTVGGAVLPIARSSKAEFLQALAAWVGKE